MFQFHVHNLCEVESVAEAKRQCSRLFPGAVVVTCEYRDLRYCEIQMVREIATDDINLAVVETMRYVGHVNCQWQMTVSFDQDTILSGIADVNDSAGQISCKFKLSRMDRA